MDVTHEIIEQPFHVIGVTLRTHHETAMTDIPALWQRFAGGEVFAALAGRQLSPSVYAVYCEYESDDRGPYTLVLGLAAPATVDVPSLRRVEIGAGRYARVTVEGDPAQVIHGAWGWINGPWTGRRSRRFGTDFERYDPASSATRCRADILVGVA